MQPPPLSYVYVLSVPYVAALSSISGPGAWDLQYTGFLWSFVLAVGLLMILQHRKAIAFPWKLWCPWLSYVLLSLVWGGINWRHSLQDPAQMISPLIVGMVASYAIRTENQLETVMRSFVHCLLFVALVFIFFWYGPGAPYQKNGAGYCVRPAAMTVAFIGCLFVGRARRNAFLSFLGWAACLAITFLSGSRMATLVLLVLWLITPLHRQIKSRLLVSGAMCLLGWALFYSPVFQERFFPSEHGDLRQVIEGEYDGAGRFEAWPVVWKEAQEHIVFGAGAGEVGRFTAKANLPTAVSRPLNDYLTVVFEYGAFGLLILICTVLRQMHVLHKLLRKKDSAVTWALAAGYLGFFAFLIFAWTENVLVYGVYFMHPLFAVTGAAIGLTANKDLQSDRRDATRPASFAFL